MAQAYFYRCLEALAVLIGPSCLGTYRGIDLGPPLGMHGRDTGSNNIVKYIRLHKAGGRQ